MMAPLVHISKSVGIQTHLLQYPCNQTQPCTGLFAPLSFKSHSITQPYRRNASVRLLRHRLIHSPVLHMMYPVGYMGILLWICNISNIFFFFIFKDFLYVQVSITLHYFLFELGFIHTFYVIFLQYLVSGI
jgi:hypothetical protein